MDGDVASQSLKESPNMADGGKMGFLREDEGVILKKNFTLQTPRHTVRKKVQRKSKKERERAKKAIGVLTVVPRLDQRMS